MERLRGSRRTQKGFQLFSSQYHHSGDIPVEPLKKHRRDREVVQGDVNVERRKPCGIRERLIVNPGRAGRADPDNRIAW